MFDQATRGSRGLERARNAGFERYLFKPIVTGDTANLMAPSRA